MWRLWPESGRRRARCSSTAPSDDGGQDREGVDRRDRTRRSPPGCHSQCCPGCQRLAHPRARPSRPERITRPDEPSPAPSATIGAWRECQLSRRRCGPVALAASIDRRPRSALRRAVSPSIRAVRRRWLRSRSRCGPAAVCRSRSAPIAGPCIEQIGECREGRHAKVRLCGIDDGDEQRNAIAAGDRGDVLVAVRSSPHR